MNIVILGIGSRGDVAPLVGLGLRLHQAGHRVAIATTDLFADFVRAHGLEFRLLPGDTRHDLNSELGQRWQREGTTLRSLPTAIRIGNRMRANLGEAAIAAAEGADVLLCHRALAWHGFLLCRAFGIPGRTLELFPTTQVPTGDFPPVGLNLPDRGRLANRAWYRLLTSSASLLEPVALGWLRGFQRRLGLPEIGIGGLTRVLRAERWPVHHGCSPAVLPPPREWPSFVHVDGYWYPPVPSGWRPPAELVDFLHAGPPPVFFGLGSMAPGDGERLSALLVDAARRAGVRAIVQAGWSGLTASGDDVLGIGDVPHDWLFPRVAAVVHHGGAGTTGAGVRAGVPSVLTPVLADQPFWAETLRRRGVSPGSVRLTELTADALGELVGAAVHDPDIRRRAAELGQRVRSEDGAARLLDVLDRT